MTNKGLAAALGITLAFSFASQAQALEIRLCEREIRTSPLSEERGVQSALIQGFAVVNLNNRPVKLTGVTFNLKDHQNLRDSRWLMPADIAGAVKQAPQIAMLAQISAERELMNNR